MRRLAGVLLLLLAYAAPCFAAPLRVKVVAEKAEGGFTDDASKEREEVAGELAGELKGREGFSVVEDSPDLTITVTKYALINGRCGMDRLRPARPDV